jgi:hypothetical protein
MTDISPRNDYRYGTVKGQPYRFARGHANRTRGVPACGYTVDETTGCWLWGLTITRNGYGQIRANRRDGTVLAHRALYERQNGPIPEGLDLDHLCRVRHCVNPSHLEPVTRSENNLRGLLGKLTARQVEEIARDARPDGVIAAEYGVSPSHVCKIQTGAYA